MTREYIGSQEHYEDEINAYYDRIEAENKEIERHQFEQNQFEQKDYYESQYQLTQEQDANDKR